MKYTTPIQLLALMILIACGRPAEHTDHENGDGNDSDDPNEALYNQVNELHEDVMFKMADLFKLKGQLEEKIANTPSLPAEKKKGIEEAIAGLDSADRAMRDWMHAWMNNASDTADQEKMREYFETEMEKIKKVSDLTNDAIARATEELK